MNWLFKVERPRDTRSWDSLLKRDLGLNHPFESGAKPVYWSACLLQRDPLYPLLNSIYVLSKYLNLGGALSMTACPHISPRKRTIRTPKMDVVDRSRSSIDRHWCLIFRLDKSFRQKGQLLIAKEKLAAI